MGIRFTAPWGGTDVNGWNAAISRNVNDWLGQVGDFDGHGGSFHQHSNLFGPEISFRKVPMFNPFAHSLFRGRPNRDTLSNFTYDGLGRRG